MHNLRMQKITPHLWYDKEAKEAANLYVSAFAEGSKIISTQEIHNTPSGSVDILNIKILDLEFTLISAGPYFKLNPSISFVVACKTKEEVDRLWGMLSKNGKILMELDNYFFSERYGWLEDKYGLSWQIIYLKKESIKQRITPTLMFTKEFCGMAEEAMNFYTKIFENSKIENLMRYGKDQAPDKEGTIVHAEFTLSGQHFAAMDSAREHNFKFNEAISFIINCKNQKEVDYFWENLSAYPESQQCGWLKDKFGVSWQVVPEELNEMMADKDASKVARLTEAFLKMKKLEISELRRAFNGK